MVIKQFGQLDWRKRVFLLFWKKLPQIKTLSQAINFVPDNSTIIIVVGTLNAPDPIPIRRKPTKIRGIML